MESLRSPYTEVFFWGIPSSGKTCALGALLSEASERGMSTNIDCQGMGYMHLLSNVFKRRGFSCLPGSTPTDAIYEMCFTLLDAKNREHPISFIDLAGELFRAIYAESEGTLSDDLRGPLETLKSILLDKVTSNRKMHFFVLEYGGHRRDIGGVKQSQYLEVAARWLDKMNILSKATDGIYILMTKSDLAGCESEEELKQVLQDYAKTHYQGFYTSIRNLCRKHDINGGELKIVPFTIGEVMLQNYCRFAGEQASYVLDLVLENSAPLGRRGCWGKVLNFFKS